MTPRSEPASCGLSVFFLHNVSPTFTLRQLRKKKSRIKQVFNPETLYFSMFPSLRCNKNTHIKLLHPMRLVNTSLSHPTTTHTRTLTFFFFYWGSNAHIKTCINCIHKQTHARSNMVWSLFFPQSVLITQPPVLISRRLVYPFKIGTQDTC